MNNDNNNINNKENNKYTSFIHYNDHSVRDKFLKHFIEIHFTEYFKLKRDLIQQNYFLVFTYLMFLNEISNSPTKLFCEIMHYKYSKVHRLTILEKFFL